MGYTSILLNATVCPSPLSSVILFTSVYSVLSHVHTLSHRPLTVLSVVLKLVVESFIAVYFTCRLCKSEVQVVQQNSTYVYTGTSDVDVAVFTRPVSRHNRRGRNEAVDSGQVETRQRQSVQDRGKMTTRSNLYLTSIQNSIKNIGGF